MKLLTIGGQNPDVLITHTGKITNIIKMIKTGNTQVSLPSELNHDSLNSFEISVIHCWCEYQSKFEQGCHYYFLILLDIGYLSQIFPLFDNWNIINLDFNYFFASILKPFLKEVIRNLVLNAKRLERFSIRQSPGLVSTENKIFQNLHCYT